MLSGVRVVTQLFLCPPPRQFAQMGPLVLPIRVTAGLVALAIAGGVFLRYEAATHRLVPLPAVPVGEINGVQSSANEQWMALYVNGSRSPSNLYLLELGTGKLKQLTQNLSAEVDPANLVEARVVRFPSYDGVAIPSLLYRPLDRKSTRLNSSHH